MTSLTCNVSDHRYHSLTQKAAPRVSAPCSAIAYGGRTRIEAVLSIGETNLGTKITVCGWAKTVRAQGTKLCFIELNDGSCNSNLQIVCKNNLENFAEISKAGVSTSFSITGTIVKSPAAEQTVELSCSDPAEGHRVKIFGSCDAAVFPLAKKNHTKEYLREIAHLRPRTYFFAAVTRMRSAMALATHTYFQQRGHFYIHTPIITASDCEGAGEMFQVTTMLPGKEPVEEDLKAILPLTKDKSIDYSSDFFKNCAYLTVSGQLSVECFCTALSDVYTFGPTFRAEKSHTSRHLAEFWMIEPEMAFCDLDGLMDCAESYLKFLVQYALDHCEGEVAYFTQNQDKSVKERLIDIARTPFHRISYCDAIEILTQHMDEFTEKVYWGIDLSSQHERYLTETVFKGPVIVYDYPAAIKAFYMKGNPDKRTVRAMDVLIPHIGEIIGGSQREDDHDVLIEMLKVKKLDPKLYWWYLDLRKYGTVPHSGFGLGFERLIMLVTGIDNIRDTIPYPRYPGNASF